VGQYQAVSADSEMEWLYREEGARLYWALLAYSGDREIAADAEAEAFAQAIVRQGELHSPLGWIYKVAFRVAAGELKRRGRMRELTDTPFDPPEPSDLVSALAKLSERQRACVVLHHYAGYPLAEVAQILGSTKPTVGVHLTRGRRKLKDLLGVRDD
jgi:RNA polymerase sigma factor (sigma-70 family)